MGEKQNIQTCSVLSQSHSINLDRLADWCTPFGLRSVFSRLCVTDNLTPDSSEHDPTKVISATDGSELIENDR